MEGIMRTLIFPQPSIIDALTLSFLWRFFRTPVPTAYAATMPAEEAQLYNLGMISTAFNAGAGQAGG
jgi:hypothetical protein